MVFLNKFLYNVHTNLYIIFITLEVFSYQIYMQSY